MFTKNVVLALVVGLIIGGVVMGVLGDKVRPLFGKAAEYNCANYSEAHTAWTSAYNQLMAMQDRKGFDPTDPWYTYLLNYYNNLGRLLAYCENLNT